VFKTAIWLSWTRRLHVREKLLPARDILRVLDEGKRLGDNLEREAEEINPGRLKRETRRWNEGFKGTQEFPEPCSRDGSTVTELQKITLAIFLFLVLRITVLLVQLFLDLCDGYCLPENCCIKNDIKTGIIFSYKVYVSPWLERVWRECSAVTAYTTSPKFEL